MKENEESWEELDLVMDNEDDNDNFFSLLRPCKRLKDHNTLLPQSPLHDLTNSQSPKSLENSQSKTLENSQSKTLDSHSHSTPTTSFRRIPGPAGAVQAALHRRMSYQNQKSVFGCEVEAEEEDLLPTQEYLRRVVENGDERDGDFTGASWNFAADFVRVSGLGKGMSLSSIKDCCRTTYRVPLVVAIIKTCSPNGLGDTMLTLKDPSGMIGANIHWQVLSEEEFGKNISVGAVIILKEVVVFSPSRTAHYLNITHGNVIKVIPKDSGPSSKQNLSISAIHESASGISEKACSQLKGRIEGMLDEIRASGYVKGTAENYTRARNNYDNQMKTVETEELVTIQDLDIEGLADVAVEEHTTNNGIEDQLGKEGHHLKQVDGDHENVIMTDSTKQGYLPEWTDDQLNDLFDMDSE